MSLFKNAIALHQSWEADPLGMTFEEWLTMQAQAARMQGFNDGQVVRLKGPVAFDMHHSPPDAYVWETLAAGSFVTVAKAFHDGAVRLSCPNGSVGLKSSEAVNWIEAIE